MKVLIVEDDFTSRSILNEFLQPFGQCDIAKNGREAIAAFQTAIDDDDSYDLICLDIMMPELDGQEVLKQIRQIEQQEGINLEHGVRVMMTSALDDASNVIGAFRSGCEAYIVKPIDRRLLLEELVKLGLISKKVALAGHL